MDVYKLTELVKNFSQYNKDFCETGKNDKDFKLFLDANFSYYCDTILVGSDFSSNILYQYDFEAETLKSSFNEIQLNLITDWKLSFVNERLTLSLFEEDVLWASFSIVKLTFLELS